MADQETAGIEAKAAPAAPVDTKLTIVAGRTTSAAAVVKDGVVTRFETLKTEFSPKIVIDYHRGGGATYLSNIDPRFILPGESTAVANKYWSLGNSGWIVLGFPEGFPASPDYRLFFDERGSLGELVDFYVAQDIDRGSPAVHQPSHPINGVFGDEPEDADFRQATPEQTRPGASWPPWIPQDHWLYLGWIRGQSNAAERGKMTLGNIPYGDYYYLLLHDRRSASEEGADVASIKIVQNHVTTDLYLLLVIDNSHSAITELNKYRECIRSIIARLPIGVRKVRLGVRLIEDVREFRVTNDPVKRAETLARIRAARRADRTEAAVKTPRLRFAINGGSAVYWQLLEPANIAAVTETVCGRIEMDRLTSPILGALSAVLKEEFEELKTEIERRASELRIILITDGFPDPYNDYATPADLEPESRPEIAGKVNGEIKRKLEVIRPGLTSNSFQLIGQYGQNETWLRDLWASLGMVSVLPPGTGEPAPENMHAEVPHTDCLNGSRESGRRIGAGEARREVAGQPLPRAWTTTG